MFGFLGSLVSAIFPPAAPFIGAIGQALTGLSVVRALTGNRGARPGGGTFTVAPGPVVGPGHGHWVTDDSGDRPTQRWVVDPVGEDMGGGLGPFIGDGGTISAQPGGTDFNMAVDPGAPMQPTFNPDFPAAPTGGVDIGSLVGQGITAVRGAISSIFPTLPGGPGGPLTSTITPGQVAIGGAAVLTTALALRVLPGILRGTTLGSNVLALYARLRGAGHSHKRARSLALAAAGVRLRRRRMRSTNVSALRRAIRRVHGFKRIASKVGALGVGKRRLLPVRRFRGRIHRRGDLDPFLVEDRADMIDEAEDLGFDPGDLFSDQEEATG